MVSFDDDIDPVEYRDGCFSARQTFTPDETVNFDVWAMTVLTLASLGPSRSFREGYVDEARKMWRERQGIVADN